MEQTAELGRQALKARLTREKILNAVIALIKEGGFGAASSSKIAKRAGVTWGAVQHHFGSKDDILEAILDMSHEQFTASMQVPELKQGSMADRVERFVHKMWEHYQSELYLAAMEILLATRGLRDEEYAARRTREQGKTHLRLMREIFPDAAITDEQCREALIFCHSTLTGLTLERVLEPQTRDFSRYLQRIKLMLLGMLSGV